MELTFVPTDDRFGHDDEPNGAVTISHVEEGKGSFAALFRMEDGSTAVVTGRMPGEQGSLWNGRTMVHVAEGTGGFADWVGHDIPLETENPKRWG